ncbi:MAG TPA: ABC transporter permease [Candidatus Binataceae bacterium]|nr:ABC transporter permease [Candidatus Binataceae bacterium]
MELTATARAPFAILSALLKPIAALAIAFGLIAIVLLALGASPGGVLAALVEGAFGNWLAFTDTLVKATPLVFTGLAVAIAFEGALWNIGAEGQLIVGALVAGALGPALGGWVHPIAISAILAGGFIGGALWGALAGWLKSARNVNEVISTIMLNFVAQQLLSWAVHGPLIEPGRAYPKSAPIAVAARLHLYLAPSRLNLGMGLAIALAVACFILLYKTTVGLELRALGRNRRACRFFGVQVGALTVGAMALSGGLAGLGGAVQLSAITHRLYESFSPGWGFEAIAVALVARLNPLGVLPCALLFGALDNGAQAMQRTAGVSPVLVQVIEALVILILLAFDTGIFSVPLGNRFRSAAALPAASLEDLDNA